MPDVTDFSRDCDNVCHSLVPSSVCMEDEVHVCMSGCPRFKRYIICVRVCMSGEEAGAGEWG